MLCLHPPTSLINHLHQTYKTAPVTSSAAADQAATDEAKAARGVDPDHPSEAVAGDKSQKTGEGAYLRHCMSPAGSPNSNFVCGLPGVARGDVCIPVDHKMVCTPPDPPSSSSPQAPRRTPRRRAPASRAPTASVRARAASSAASAPAGGPAAAVPRSGRTARGRDGGGGCLFLVCCLLSAMSIAHPPAPARLK